MKGYGKVVILILVSLAILIPLASSDPDGLEKVAETLEIEESESDSPSPMPDYAIPTIENEYKATLIAGIIGVFLVLGTGFMLGKLIMYSTKK